MSVSSVELEFDTEEWSRLTTSERIRRCLLFAEQARAQGASAPPDVKKVYQDLAQHWLALAHEIETNDPRSTPSARPS